MSEVQIKNINQGGIADSDYVGNENSVSEAVNCDIHSEAGIIKANQALVKDSASVVDELCLASVSCSNGSTYHFGDSGAIFERQANGTWTDHGTTVPAVGAAKVLSAEEYQGYIYYAMQNRLGRFAIPTAGVAPTQDDSWATFGVGNATFHPMHEVNLVLYIGDGNQVAQVDAGTFSANALDIKTPLVISSLWNLDTDLLIGTYVAANILRSEIIRWNTWSVSFSVSDPIPEAGINAFLDTDNVVIVNAGVKGNLYIYDGAQLSTYKRIKGTWTGTNQAKINTNATYNFNGMPLFALSQVSDEGVNLGVYSIARTSRDYPNVLNLEYAISTGNLIGIQIGTITPISADQFLVTWRDDNGTPSYGVDLVSLTVKATAHFVTRVMTITRQAASEWGLAYAGYRLLPASTEIKFYSDVNHAGFGSALATTPDEERLVVETDAGIGDANTLKMKTELVPNNNDAPEVEVAIFELNDGQ